MSIEEQTTTITYDAGIDEAIITTSVTKDIKKLKKIAKEYNNQVKIISEDKHELTVSVPKRYIKIHPIIRNIE